MAKRKVDCVKMTDKSLENITLNENSKLNKIFKTIKRPQLRVISASTNDLMYDAVYFTEDMDTKAENFFPDIMGLYFEEIVIDDIFHDTFPRECELRKV